MNIENPLKQSQGPGSNDPNGERLGFEQELERVCKEYPELAEKVQRSLKTPQLGEYHNEGPTMDHHLALILKNLESIKNDDDRFFDSIQDSEVRALLREVVVTQDVDNPEEVAVNPMLVDYTFFHDISKPDCLTLKLEGEKKGTEITWEQWLDIATKGKPYQLDGKSITSISYFHQSEGVLGQHGNKAVEVLREAGLPEDILVAISKHEVAYQFGNINTATYEKHFVEPGFSEEKQKFILVASYIDTMASLGPDGQPDLTNFTNLVKSRNNYLLIKQYTDNGIVFRENELGALKKQNKVLTIEDVEKIIPREVSYDLTILAGELDMLVSEGHVSDEEKRQILEIVAQSPDDLGKTFGQKMRFIKPLLARSKK